MPYTFNIFFLFLFFTFIDLLVFLVGGCGENNLTFIQITFIEITLHLFKLRSSLSFHSAVCGINVQYSPLIMAQK